MEAFQNLMGYASIHSVICVKFNKHELSVDSVRNEYQNDVNRGPLCNRKTSYLSVDMQKVVMMTCMPGYKTAIFTKRIAFHETFAPIGSFVNKKPQGVVWNESISGRNATDI